jgi:hypothetical protein
VAVDESAPVFAFRDAEARVSIATTLPVPDDRAARFVTPTDAANPLQALEDSIEGSHDDILDPFREVTRNAEPVSGVIGSSTPRREPCRRRR